MQTGLSETNKTGAEVPARPQIRFSFVRSGKQHCGVARVVHFNAATMCFDAEVAAPIGCKLEVRLCWPAASEHFAEAELVLDGPIIGYQPSGTTTIRVDHYELQLCGDRSFQTIPVRAATCDVLM